MHSCGKEAEDPASIIDDYPNSDAEAFAYVNGAIDAAVRAVDEQLNF